ncbi:hypothetical protein [Phyllobacterium endophyticum]|uniref:hypothetical protein n=1 Tax=Phyllobacterium endophyticum TaxID=1149773 RepID=UPI00178EA6E6|nr:hypothetical protein [Phyllobacterium endophyticum]MBB3237196.1 hypothetical protein [Phyllobacterium endophyticum]
MPVCAYVEMTDGLQPRGPAWEQFAQAIGKCRPDILLMNEMPFGQWLARKNDFVVEDAQQSVEIHEAGTAALAALNIPAVITSRPMLLADRLANEAIVIENGEFAPCIRRPTFRRSLVGPRCPGSVEAMGASTSRIFAC